jgi:hypothetical protein
MSVVKELNEIADLLDTMHKKATQKQAGFFSIGDQVVCLNPIEGICKGQIYRITGIPAPNNIAIEDIYGNEIGLFREDRFCAYNQEF